MIWNLRTSNNNPTTNVITIEIDACLLTVELTVTDDKKLRNKYLRKIVQGSINDISSRYVLS